MHHGLPKVLGARLTSCVTPGDVARCAILRHDVRVVYRDIVQSLVEIAERIASRLHDFSDEPIGFRHCAARIVDEPPLELLPPLSETGRIGGAERADVQLFDAFGSGLERRLCAPDDVANAMVYLASDEAAFVTGTVLEVDGGRSI